MNTPKASFHLSLLIHLVLAYGFLYGQQLLDKDTPPLVMDLSLSVSEAMAGEPDQKLGAANTAPTSTPKTAPTRSQAVSTPQEPKNQTATKPVKVAQPPQKKAKPKPKAKKVRKEPLPLVQETTRPAPLSKRDQAQPKPAVASSATTSASGAPPSASTASPSSNAQAPATAGTGAKGGNLGKGSGMRYDFNYVRQRILRNLKFPATARKMGLSGKIVVSFLLKADGQVERITVVSSSGYEILDHTVVTTIRRVAPFPRPPVSAQLMLPIVFHLKS